MSKKPKPLDPHEDRYCELVGLHGYRETDAVREVWPLLAPASIYTKVKRLSRRDLIQTQVEHYNQVALAEPRRLLKIAQRTSATILSDASHKNYVGTLNVMAQLSGRLDKEKHEEKPVNVSINLKLEE